jgi:hypothetical protein
VANKIYYLTGMGGRLNQGLGEELMRRGLTVTGRELVDEFRSLDFQSQVSLVSEDLWDELSACNRRVIANSFGAYLFLHAQADRKPFAGKVLLLSPIVGEFSDEETLRTFVPPRSRRIFEMLELETYPIPLDCEIHTGENDWQSNPQNVNKIGNYFACKVNIVPNAGHILPKEYVRSALDNWI